jgi:nucleoid-associated protein YgaU
MNGKLEKLTIIPYSSNAYTERAGEPYVVLINPDELVEEMNVEYTAPATDGGAGATGTFKMIKAPKMSLKLLFDGTGVLNTENGKISSLAVNEKKLGLDEALSSTLGTVSEQIKKFKEVTTDIKGVIHEPGYVKLFWGETSFQGRILTLKITYTLFSSDGKPLRAIGEAVFQNDLASLERNQRENRTSPDLTHVRTVREGDTLPLMCARIYKNPKLYLEIARVNGLSNYRNLEVGAKLFFPPINNN